MQLTKIVITGGPCAGKTTAMNQILERFTARGYRVLFVPETATELISGGVAPWTLRTNADYQQCQMLLQKRKEEIFIRAAGRMDADRILLVCDRGMLDNKAYMTEEEFRQVLEAIQFDEEEERNQYDAVFHLVTAARGALEAYTLANNGARYETPEKAVEVDERILAAWEGHPHLRVIDNSTTFEEKLDRLDAEILAFLERG